jgi:predicted nucleic acid-binding protein
VGLSAVRIYLDSCALIYRIERTTPWAARVDRVVEWGQHQQAEWVITELTRLECRVKPLMQGHAAMLAQYDEFFAADVLVWHGLDRPVCELATRLRAEHRLKTADALHLAAAVHAGCSLFLTNDRRLSGAAQAVGASRPIRVLALDTDTDTDVLNDFP